MYCTVIPVLPLPTPETGKAMVITSAWKKYCIFLQAWLQVGDSAMGLWLASIAADSNQDLEDRLPIMTEKQIIIDGTMAQSMLQTLSSIMRAHLEAEETFKLQHNFSGLLIIQTFSKIINKKTAKGCQQALAINAPNADKKTCGAATDVVQCHAAGSGGH